MESDAVTCEKKLFLHDRLHVMAELSDRGMGGGNSHFRETLLPGVDGGVGPHGWLFRPPS